MKFLIARPVGFTPEMYEAIRALGLEPVFLPAGADGRPGPEEAAYESVDFSDIDAVFCYRFFCYNDIARFPKLKYIHTTSHGLDHMPLDYIRAHGIRLCDARGVYGVPMAEYALGGVLQLYKAFPLLAAQQRDRVWRHPETVRELTGRQVTLLGAGSVGTECAKRFSAMGCRCVGLCRHPKDGAEGFDAQRGIDTLDALLPETDILLVTLPLTDETRGMLDARRFALLKDGAVLVNMARGHIVDEAAMAAALKSGRLSGAVVDVFDAEPLPADSPLWALPNCIVTPHSSFIGEHDPKRLFSLLYCNTVNWLNEQGGSP
jgi:phosphoglycerate dehydrogenase-like enzyme